MAMLVITRGYCHHLLVLALLQLRHLPNRVFRLWRLAAFTSRAQMLIKSWHCVCVCVTLLQMLKDLVLICSLYKLWCFKPFGASLVGELWNQIEPPRLWASPHGAIPRDLPSAAADLKGLGRLGWLWHIYPYGCVWKWLVPLNPMVLLIIIPIKWLFHWEYTQHFQTNPYLILFCSLASQLYFNLSTLAYVTRCKKLQEESRYSMVHIFLMPLLPLRDFWQILLKSVGLRFSTLSNLYHLYQQPKACIKRADASTQFLPVVDQNQHKISPGSENLVKYLTFYIIIHTLIYFLYIYTYLYNITHIIIHRWYPLVN